MKKIIGIIIALLILLLLPKITLAVLSCSIATTCPDTDVFHISALTNAHAELNTQSNYNQKVCCKDTGGAALTTTCNADSLNVLLHLSAQTNAHAELSSESNYIHNVCLSTTQNYKISYAYAQDCTGYDTCIAALSTAQNKKTNLQLADCSTILTSIYTTKLCATLMPNIILNRAYWNPSTAQEGETVNLVVEANAAAIGKTASFTIVEDDIIGDDPVNQQPANAVFILSGTGSIATTTWTAEWQNDGWFGGDPEYKFTAFVNILQIASSEPKLTVSKSMPSCGNGQGDSGENCQNCAEDAGCSSGKLCCTSDSAIECKSSCEIEPPGGCQDQYCRPGYVCSDEDLCNCNAESDDICPSYLSNDCRAVDPDCEIPVECSECIADGVCKPDCILNTACPADPDCTCEIYNSYLGDPNIYECPEDQCSEWNARIECCTGACGSSDCFIGWTCPDWSKCVNGYRTRGACTSTSVSAECQDQVGAYFRSEQKKACIETVKFSVYDNLNLLFGILILMGYYLVRRRF